jgi:hypothetical protein
MSTFLTTTIKMLDPEDETKDISRLWTFNTKDIHLITSNDQGKAVIVMTSDYRDPNGDPVRYLSANSYEELRKKL